MPEVTVKDLISKAMFSSSFRNKLAADPVAAAKSINLEIDDAQAATLKNVAAKLNTNIAKSPVRIDRSAVEGHGSISW